MSHEEEKEQEDVMEIEDIFEKLEQIERDHANNTQEPLAAHWLTPLLKEMLIHIHMLSQEVQDLAEEQSDASPYSQEFLTTIKGFLYKLGFQSFLDKPDAPLPKFASDARAFYLWMCAEEHGVTIEEFSDEFFQNGMVDASGARPLLPPSPAPVETQRQKESRIEEPQVEERSEVLEGNPDD